MSSVAIAPQSGRAHCVKPEKENHLLCKDNFGLVVVGLHRYRFKYIHFFSNWLKCHNLRDDIRRLHSIHPIGGFCFAEKGGASSHAEKYAFGIKVLLTPPCYIGW